MPTHTLKLTGLNGDNPLAFLAALGAFRTAQQLTNSEIRLGWTALKNSWYPFLQGEDDLLSSPDILTKEFYFFLAMGNPAFCMANKANNPKMPAKLFEQVTRDAIEKWFDTSSKEFINFVIALGNESVLDKYGNNEDTYFRTMQGAGHQHFLKSMRELTLSTNEEHLKEALFETWQYNDTGYSMRWDPGDDRRYALRWNNPSNDPARNVRGANRLAIEGLPLYPTMPTTQSLETTGFKRHKNSKVFWTWPLWEPPITFDVCRSLLAHPELQQENPAMDKLKSVGVFAVLRSQRITLGKFRNFTPALPIG